MKLTVTFIFLSLNSVWAFNELDLDYNDDLTYVPEYYSEARLLNITFDGFLNNSLLTLGAIFVVGVVLFGKILLLLHEIFCTIFCKPSISDHPHNGF